MPKHIQQILFEIQLKAGIAEAIWKEKGLIKGGD